MCHVSRRAGTACFVAPGSWSRWRRRTGGLLVGGGIGLGGAGWEIGRRERKGKERGRRLTAGPRLSIMLAQGYTDVITVATLSVAVEVTTTLVVSEITVVVTGGQSSGAKSTTAGRARNVLISGAPVFSGEPERNL